MPPTQEDRYEQFERAVKIIAELAAASRCLEDIDDQMVIDSCFLSAAQQWRAIAAAGRAYSLRSQAARS